MSVKLNTDKIKPFVDHDPEAISGELKIHYQQLVHRSGPGNDFLGWIDLPVRTDQQLLSRIREDAQQLAACSEVVVVIGIGGSYLGARAVIEALSSAFPPCSSGKAPRIVFAGQNLSGAYHSDLLAMLDEKDYSLIVISKSGTTTEPALAFRILKEHLEKKYGKQNTAARIIAITDPEKGALRKMAMAESYRSYVIPDDVGGRYSVLTPVGLLPVAAAGFNIAELIRGAAEMRESLLSASSVADNVAVRYAAARNLLYRKGKYIEVMVGYEPSLLYFIEWWKQLYGESEGKDGKGIFPAGTLFTTDLHSMGQYLQDGLRCVFETVVNIENPAAELIIPYDHEDADGLNYIAGKSFSEVNLMAQAGTKLAHLDGGVPVMEISIPVMNENNLGRLLYFFEFACALSGYILGVNPFDQPGVEAYKKNMFALLGKKGFEKEGDSLRKRL